MGRKLEEKERVVRKLKENVGLLEKENGLLKSGRESGRSRGEVSGGLSREEGRVL